MFRDCLRGTCRWRPGAREALQEGGPCPQLRLRTSPDVVSQLLEPGWAVDMLAWAEGGGGGRALCSLGASPVVERLTQKDAPETARKEERRICG